MTEEFREQVYLDYHIKVLRYIQSKVHSLTLAEDLCSEVFLKVYEKLEDYDAEKSKLSTWIFSITRNKLIDYYRTRRVMEEIPETLEDGSRVEESVCSKEMLETLADALEQMDERERDIIILRYYSGKTLREIADQLGISYAYVKVLQNKAFATLKEKLGE